jgi:hypothetical protein
MMGDEIKLVAMTLAALDGMPPEQFHAHDEAFRIGYYRRAHAVIEGLRSPNDVIEMFDAAPGYPAPTGEPCYPSVIDNGDMRYFAPLLAHRHVNEVRVGGIPWNKVPEEPTAGEWRHDRLRGVIEFGGTTGGGRVIAYLSL